MKTRGIALLLLAALAAGCQQPDPTTSTTVTTSPVAAVSTSGPGAAASSSTAPATPAPSPSPSPTPVPTPSPTPKPTPKPAVPPKPASTTWNLVGSKVSADNTTVTLTYRATWSEPAGAATKFLLYGVTRCLREAAANDNTPCIVRGMPIPRDSLVLLGTAPGDARTMTIHWTRYTGAGPDPYWSYLIRASNSAGNSIFTILATQDVCWQCAY